MTYTKTLTKKSIKSFEYRYFSIVSLLGLFVLQFHRNLMQPCLTSCLCSLDCARFAGTIGRRLYLSSIRRNEQNAQWQRNEFSFLSRSIDDLFASRNTVQWYKKKHVQKLRMRFTGTISKQFLRKAIFDWESIII